MSEDELYEKIHNVGFQKGKLEQKKEELKKWQRSLILNLKV